MAQSDLSRSIEGKMLSVLTKMAGKIAADAMTNASTKTTSNGKNLPSEIVDAIGVGKVKSSGNGRYSISVEVDLGIAPMAAAYEFGSGERGKEGQDYPIVAKDAPALAFMWKYPSPLGRKMKPMDEFVYFPKPNAVMHPGVEAVPYLTPAIKDNMQALKLQIALSARQAIVDVTPKIVIIRPT